MVVSGSCSVSPEVEFLDSAALISLKKIQRSKNTGKGKEQDRHYSSVVKITSKLSVDRLDVVTVRGHHSPPPITPATSDSPRYIPPHKRLNHRQLLETRP